MADTISNRITVRCACGAKLALRATAAGHNARCPKCRQSFVVPSPEVSGGESQPGAAYPRTPPATRFTTASFMTVHCACGKAMRVPASSEGQKARCPVCASVFVISAVQVQASQPPQIQSPSARHGPAALELPRDADIDDDHSLLDDLADGEMAPGAITPVPSQAIAANACPQCRHPLSANAPVCPACGHETRTAHFGETLGAAAGGGLRILGGLAKTCGPLVLGTGLSAVGALVGAGIWFAVARATGYESGWVAWGVGALTGGGMLIGRRGDQGVNAGVIAAGMSLLGIIGAKAMIFVFVMYAILTGDTNDIELQRAYVAAQLAEETLTKRGVASEAQREQQWDAAYDEAERRVAKMSTREVRQRWAEFRDSQRTEAVEAQPDDRDTTGSDLSPKPGPGPSETETAAADQDLAADEQGESDDLLGFFFQTMFGFLDIVFVFLAVATAFKIAGGGFTE